MLPEPIKKFIAAFAALPSIGPRQATRLAFHIKDLGKAGVKEIADAVAALSDVQACPTCFNTIEEEKCRICHNPQRRQDIIAIVEKETDLMSLEKTKKFNGRYLVIGNLPKGGMLDSMQKLRLNSLKSWIKTDLEQRQAEEVILAINPTAYGDLSAEILKQELKDCAKKITRLGRGIPTGGEIEFADEDTLSGALENRN